MQGRKNSRQAPSAQLYLSGSQCPLHRAAEEDLSAAAGRHAAPHDLQLQLLVGQQQVAAQNRQAAVLQLVHRRVRLAAQATAALDSTHLLKLQLIQLIRYRRSVNSSLYIDGK